MATKLFLKSAIFLSCCAFVLMFVAFASPYWYQSWTRVHSSFGNIGLWHICLNGYIMPRDPVMKSYVGCWWIHSSEFDVVKDDLQPVWFRFIQAFCVFTLFGNLIGAALTICYQQRELREKLYKKRPRQFFINSAFMLGSAFLVFLIALVFAEKSRDETWMPRPWMNYLSWSFGLCVLSGFFSAFAGMCLFLLALIYKDKEENGDPGVTSAADMAKKRKELESQDEVMRNRMAMETRNQPQESAPPYRQDYQVRPQHYPSRPAFQDRPDAVARKARSDYSKADSDTASQSTRVGESFV